MNLNSNNFTIVTCFLLLFLSSCKKDFLEVIPKGKRIAENTSDYNLLMNSPVFYMYQSGGWQAAVLMGDEIGAEQGEFNSSRPQVQRYFRWDAVIYDQLTDEAQDLRNFLPNIYACNLIINGVINSKNGTESEKKVLQAEAAATRAWIYFQLVNLYAKPYQSSTANTDPGFPVITKADVMENYFSRGTVQQTYDFILNDLNTAIPDLPINQPIATRMNKAAANALLAKVYLFMGKADLALPLLNAAFDNNAAAVAPAKLYDYNATFAPGGSFLPISSRSGPASPGNIVNDFTESVLAKTFGNSYASGNSGIVITPETAGLYSTGDFRLNFYTNLNMSGAVIPGGRLRKYGVSFSKFGIALSEMYLLRAECKARLNDLIGAKADLETLRIKRIAPAKASVPTNIAADRILLIKFIFDERIREFAAEGYRWFDMRRLSVDPLFSGLTFTHNIYPASGPALINELQLPARLVLKLPPNIMAANPSFQNNP